jgi:hypothetical protein
MRVSLLEQRASVCLHVRAFDDPDRGRIGVVVVLLKTNTNRSVCVVVNRVDECRHERPASIIHQSSSCFFRNAAECPIERVGKNFHPHDQFMVYEGSSSSNLKTYQIARREKISSKDVGFANRRNVLFLEW